MSWDTTPATNAGHSLTATASDTIGQKTTSSPASVTVSNSAPSGIALSVRAYKTKGYNCTRLTWAPSTSADVYRNGSKLTSSQTGTPYTDGPLGKGGRSATYQVCATATSCSNAVTVVW